MLLENGCLLSSKHVYPMLVWKMVVCCQVNVSNPCYWKMVVCYQVNPSNPR